MREKCFDPILAKTHPVRIYPNIIHAVIFKYGLYYKGEIVAQDDGFNARAPEKRREFMKIGVYLYFFKIFLKDRSCYADIGKLARKTLAGAYLTAFPKFLGFLPVSVYGKTPDNIVQNVKRGYCVIKIKKYGNVTLHRIGRPPYRIYPYDPRPCRAPGPP